MNRFISLIVALTLSTPAFASGLDGAHMGLVWVVPFAGLLLSIAIGQAFFTHWWEHHFGKVTAFWLLATIGGMAATAGSGVAAHTALHVFLIDYLPFLIGVGAIYAIAGGIHIRTKMSGHPTENAFLLGFGTLMAGAMGTPGATLLFLPLMLSTNKWREYRVHTVIFLIFLVSNMGGGFTPLGPPLIMGLLKGVPFGWTLSNMMAPTVVTSAILLGIYWLIDRFVFFPKEDATKRAAHREEHCGEFSVQGGVNFFLLIAVIALIIECGEWKVSAAANIGGVELSVPDLVRMLGMMLLAYASMHHTEKHVRTLNDFQWGPMKEIAILFAGIFITMAPVLMILGTGTEGAMGGVIRLVSDEAGQPINWLYFLITGMLSGVLDNAPTWVVFFNAAGGDAQALMQHAPLTLEAISSGAAYWGGLTYIGNAPNFVVLAVALAAGVRMPNFFSYLIWPVTFLIPTFAVINVVFFGAPLWILGSLVLLGGIFFLLPKK